VCFCTEHIHESVDSLSKCLSTLIVWFISSKLSVTLVWNLQGKACSFLVPAVLLIHGAIQLLIIIIVLLTSMFWYVKDSRPHLWCFPMFIGSLFLYPVNLRSSPSLNVKSLHFATCNLRSLNREYMEALVGELSLISSVRWELRIKWITANLFYNKSEMTKTKYPKLFYQNTYSRSTRMTVLPHSLST
jgi:hypothetical protein